MSMVCESTNKSETNVMESMEPSEPTEVSQKYWYLESVLKLEDEINRDIELISKIASEAAADDDIRLIIGIELSKAKMLKKGKLKMFRDLCLVALKEIPPIEGDKEVTVDDLEGFWCLLGIESEKHRQSITFIMNPKSSDNDKIIGDVIDNAAGETNSISSTAENKDLKAEIKAAMKVKKTNIDERNRKYMERMKKLKERKAKPIVQDKENSNPNQTNKSKEVKLKLCDNVTNSASKIPVKWQN